MTFTLHLFAADRMEATADVLSLTGEDKSGSFGPLARHERFMTAQTFGPALLVAGHRLGTKLDRHPGVIARLDGPTVTEEVPAVLNRLMDALHAASGQLTGEGAALFGLAHDGEGEPALRRLLPLSPPPASPFAHPPRLNLVPPEFFAELLDQYLLATLYGLLYESLAAENRQRLAHMENALDRLDGTIGRLALKRNALRQEKIVEEIEVILSSRMVPGRATLRT